MIESPLRLLSTIEHQVASLVVRSRSNQEIADELHVTDMAVKKHLSKIFDKLGVWSRVELAIYMTRESHRLRLLNARDLVPEPV